MAQAFNSHVSRQARVSYIALFSIRRTFSTTSIRTSPTNYHRSDLTGQPCTGSYEPGLPTAGPLGGASSNSVPNVTPRKLKEHLDLFVVGQDRAKRKLSSEVYYHYQRVQELQRRREEEQQAWSGMTQNQVEEDETAQSPAHVRRTQQNSRSHRRHFESSPIVDSTPLTIEKSNIMILGPSGSGKTLMAKTLARKLDVPFSMSDCTPFTQAGYIGEDVDVCVHRLLAAANYDVAQAERGIICLDEIDKIAATRLSHGKDVGGEGVQQALLKILEGTTLQISARQERGGGRPSTSGGYSGGNGGGLGGGSSGGPGAKNEVYNVRTDDILFLVSGAFNGLNKIVRDRIGRGGMGFSQLVRVAKPDGSDWVSKAEEDHYKKHLPFFTSNEFNPLDLVEPSDLIKFGLIPELVGRIPVTTALAPLSAEDLVRVLTEPRNAVLRQFEQQLQLNGVELRCTTAALHEIARVAKGMETGARGLRAVLERLLGDAKHEVPGSSIKFIVVTEAVAKRQQEPIYLARGQAHVFYAIIAEEEKAWEARQRKEGDVDEVQNFEQYREKARSAGFV